jgi:hypothetical protein
MGSACSSDSGGKVGLASSTFASLPRDVDKSHKRGPPGGFKPILDSYETIEEVTVALREAGLESSDLILAIDLTRSNERSGTQTFHGVLCTLCLA